MIVKSKVNIKYNGNRYPIGEDFEIEDKHFESIKDIVEVIEKTPDDNKNGLLNDDLSGENTPSNVIDYEELTKAEIVDILKEKGIEFNSRDKKEDLIELLLGSE